MLPNLTELTLGQGSTPTGEFLDLSVAAVEKLKSEGELETFSQEEFGLREYFRVRSKNADDNGEYNYSMYDARKLWQWVSVFGHSVPATGEPIWREDWWELHDRFAPAPAPAPSWVQNLPQLDSSQPDLHSYEEMEEGRDVPDQLVEEMRRGLSVGPDALVSAIANTQRLRWNFILTLGRLTNNEWNVTTDRDADYISRSIEHMTTLNANQDYRETFLRDQHLVRTNNLLMYAFAHTLGSQSDAAQRMRCAILTYFASLVEDSRFRDLLLRAESNTRPFFSLFVINGLRRHTSLRYGHQTLRSTLDLTLSLQALFGYSPVTGLREVWRN